MTRSISLGLVLLMGCAIAGSSGDDDDNDTGTEADADPGVDSDASNGAPDASLTATSDASPAPDPDAAPVEGDAVACFLSVWYNPTCMACQQANCPSQMTEVFGSVHPPWPAVGTCSTWLDCIHDCSPSESCTLESSQMCGTACETTPGTPCNLAWDALNDCFSLWCISSCGF